MRPGRGAVGCGPAPSMASWTMACDWRRRPGGRWRLDEAVVAVEPVDDAQHALDGGDVDFALVHRIEPGHVGEGVEVDGAVVAVAADLAQQFDGLQRVHRADHQAVVALGVAVVEMHAEQLAVAGDQGGGKGRLLVGIEHMGEVEGDAEIGQADIADRQQGRRRIRHQAVGARLVRLVLEADLAVRDHVRQLHECRRFRVARASHSRPGKRSRSRPGRARASSGWRPPRARRRCRPWSGRWLRAAPPDPDW